MAHPLRQYLFEVNESVQDFAARVGVSRQTIYRLFCGRLAPKPSLARRIVEATGGFVSFDSLYRFDNDSSAEIVHLPTNLDDPLLDAERLTRAIETVINHLTPENCSIPPKDAIDVAVEAVINTYTALAPVTSRRGQARLHQALRPVLEEILQDYSHAPPPSVLDRGADLATEIYFQSWIPGDSKPQAP